jgi:integrase
VPERFFSEGESKHRPLKGRAGKARRSVPIPAELVPRFRAHLDEFVPRRADALVFTTPTGRRIHLSNFHRDVWKPAREQVCPEDSPLLATRRRDLRHSAITAWLNAGVMLKTAQRGSGHRTASVLLNTYLGVMRDDLSTSIARVEEALAKAQQDAESWRARDSAHGNERTGEEDDVQQ